MTYLRDVRSFLSRVINRRTSRRNSDINGIACLMHIYTLSSNLASEEKEERT